MALTPEQFFGKIGVKNGVFTQTQLDACFAEQRRIFLETGEREPLSYILMERSLMTHEQSRDLLQEFKYSCMRKDDKEIATISVEQDMLTDEQIEAALLFQRKLFRGGVGIFQLGEILISRGFLTSDQVYALHCEHYLRRHPGATIKPLEQVPASESAAETKVPQPVADKEVEVIRKGASFKECPFCNYKNPHVAQICYQCGEPLPEDEVIDVETPPRGTKAPEAAGSKTNGDSETAVRDSAD